MSPVTDVSGQPIGPILKAQTVQVEFFLDCLKLEYDTNILYRQYLVSNYQSALRNTQKSKYIIIKVLFYNAPNCYVTYSVGAI